MTSPISVAVYIDGFNLYHALLRMQDQRVKWLNLRALMGLIVPPKSEHIAALYYFSAFAKWLPGPMSRHEAYVKALEATGVNCIMGHFKDKPRKCTNCSHTWIGHEEKETDVSIGITLLNDAHLGIYEKAYLVTRDSDLMPAVKMVLAQFPTKQIVAVSPPMMGHSNDLIGVCNSKRRITPKQVIRCLFPERVFDATGAVVAVRPPEYA